MTETIYLIVSRTKVERMVKTEPSLRQLRTGEVPIKVNVTVEPKAFQLPVIEKEVYVDDWTEGLGVGDIEFKRTAITPKEAEQIRQGRLAEMQKVLEAQGYTISKPEPAE
jgi:hypothetical protein